MRIMLHGYFQHNFKGSALSDIAKYFRDQILASYKKHFFESMFDTSISGLLSFVWTDVDDGYELYMTDNIAYHTKDTLDYFKGLWRKKQKTIICFSNRPIDVDPNVIDNNNEWYVKLSYFKNDAMVIGKPAHVDNIEMLTGYNKLIDVKVDAMMRLDCRFWGNDARMKGVESAEADEFESEKNYCEHCYILWQGEPVGYIAGMRMDKSVYAHPFYLVAVIWVSASLNHDIKRSVLQELIKWLNQKSPPYAAGIYSCNVQSRRFFSRNGFLPYFVRYFPWQGKSH